jgi:hypothetical protein
LDSVRPARDDDHLIFGDICSPAIVANLRTNPSVEITCGRRVREKGLSLQGKRRGITEGPRLEQGDHFLLRPWH